MVSALDTGWPRRRRSSYYGSHSYQPANFPPLFIRDGHVTKIDTIPVFDEPARNLDQDSWLELAAYQTLTETWTDEQGREWQGYNPKLYYEVRPTGLVLDTALTKHKAVAQYGVFRGFEASEEIKISTKQSKSK